MFNIKDYLVRANSKQAKELLFRGKVQEIIKKNTGLDISVGNIVTKARRIQIKDISPTEKSLIYIKKDILIEQINKNQNIYIIDNII